MALKQGEDFRCTVPDCGCEIAVAKAAAPGEGNQNPRCCCGEQMVRQ